tara:strand:- start:1088 stop:1378 length:291 start_codon:yes stop_codon:yes gene_type:complete
MIARARQDVSRIGKTGPCRFCSLMPNSRLSIHHFGDLTPKKQRLPINPTAQCDYPPVEQAWKCSSEGCLSFPILFAPRCGNHVAMKGPDPPTFRMF